jgi:hypothetical protein
VNETSGGKAILWGGILAGILDLSAAMVQYALRGVSPVRIAQSIAAGLLGRDAFQGGAATAALGTALHFLIAFTAATVFYLASRRLPWMVRSAVPAGVAYGVAVYFFMNFVVVPLSRFPPRTFDLQNMMVQVVIHIFCVGLPIALSVRRFST